LRKNKYLIDKHDHSIDISQNIKENEDNINIIATTTTSTTNVNYSKEINKNNSVNTFISRVAPSAYKAIVTSSETKSFKDKCADLFDKIVENHEYLKMLSTVRVFNFTRKLDYLNICTRLLLSLLTTTLFYEINYPANYSCENRIYDIPANVTQKYACLEDSIMIQPYSTECEW
jgi:hypothetical protein